MKISVLGGSGLIGNAIVRELAARGHTVTVAGRRSAKPANLTDLNVAYVSADSTTPDGLELAVRRQDVVIDAAAPYPLYLVDFEQGLRRERQSNAAQRTDLLTAAVRRHDAGLVYMGTQVTDANTSANAGAGNLLDLPRQLARAIHPYFAVKRLIEDRLNVARSQGLRLMTIRPSACVGPWDIKPRNMCWVPALLNGRVTVTAQHDVNVVDTRDVAKAVASAIEQDCYGQSLSVSGVNTSVRALFEAFCATARVAPPRWTMPAGLGVLPGMWTELALAAVGMKSPLPGLIPLLICEQGRVSPTPDGAVAGITPRALQDTVTDTIAWYRSLGYC